MEKDFSKALLMNMLDKIMHASEDTLVILRNNTMSNITLIKRNAKSLKDPNPVASTMNMINDKYPITIVESKIKNTIVDTSHQCHIKQTVRCWAPLDNIELTGN
jgi:hypothetical protein